MMKTTRYVYNTDEEFLEIFPECCRTQTNLSLKYGKINFLFHPMGEKVHVFIYDSELIFNSLEDFFNNFKIDGKSFNHLLPDIDFV